MQLSERMDRFRASDLYVAVTADFCAGRSPTEILASALSAGVTIVQLREKTLDDR